MGKTATTPQAAASSNSILLGSYATIVALWALSQVIYIPYMLHLMILVTSILYAACHQSLILLHENPPAEAGGASVKSEDRETMQASDAYQFPLVGSASLFGLYLAFKFLDKSIVNFLIGFYFGAVGCFAMTTTFSPAIAKFTPESFKKQYKFKAPMDMSIEFGGNEVVAFIASLVLCLIYFFMGKPWYLNNVIGIAFCLQGIERFSLGTYKIGAILLIGLFFYDIFWVFGTEVMVTVAKNLDGPIKLLFPRSLAVNAETGKLDLSLLGLGDIVIPGFFLALLLRFDAHQAKVSLQSISAHSEFPKPYFHFGLAAYVVGLGTTLFVMNFFQAAQPALLYLVPACLGSSFACAAQRGEVNELLAYSEEEEEDDAIKNDSEGDKKETKKGK